MSDGRALKLGFIPLDDAAAMIAAHEKGFFAAEGLQVELSREMSWATIRDKIAFGALDGAHMLAPLALAMTFRGGTHDLWVRYWLAAGGINPETDVSTIVIPPPQMVANMKAGTQDAFRVGEPWNGQLVNQRIGYLLDEPFGALDALTRAHLQD